MSMKKRLILLLDDYPYSPGEYPFIKTELKYLVKEYDVSILCKSLEETQQMESDPSITVYHNRMVFGFKDKIRSLFFMIISKTGRREIANILKDRKSVAGRFYTSLSYFGCALLTRDYARKNILKDVNEEILIYSYWFNSSCLGFMLDRKKYPSMKIISRIHGYDLYNERSPYNRQPFRNQMDEAVDALFFIALKGQQYYAETFHKDTTGGKYHFAPIGTEKPSEAENHDSNRTCFELVSCSDCIPLKRIHLIIEALAAINENEIQNLPIRWKHFGDGRLYEELRTLADNRLAGKPWIEYQMCGALKVEEILNYYGQGHVDGFITTSETEGCPVSIQEALSYGIPVIGTDVGEIPNMISSCGYILNKDPSVDEIKKAILGLYNDSFDEDTINSLRKNAFSIWNERYDGEQNAKRFLSELKSIMSARDKDL